MPGTLPLVEFDFGVAEGTAATCRAFAARLDALLQRRATAGAVASDGWEGRHREAFDSVLTALQREGVDLKAQLLMTAAAIENAALEAAAENRLRNQENERRRAEVIQENERRRAEAIQERGGAPR